MEIVYKDDGDIELAVCRRKGTIGDNERDRKG